MEKTYLELFHSADDIAVQDVNGEKTHTFATTFKKVCDENGVQPYQLGKQLSAFLGTIAEGNPKPGADLVKIAWGMVQTVLAERMPKDPMAADMIKGVLFAQLSNSPAFNQFLTGAFNGV